MISVICIFALLSLATATDPLTEKFDNYLTRYNQTVIKRTPFNINKPQSFQWSSTTLVPGKTISGHVTINETNVDGLNDIVRNNSLTTIKTGLHSWNTKGQIVLAAPKITGVLHFETTEDVSLDFDPIEFVSIAKEDTAYDFESTINEHWKQVVYTSFDYNSSAPEFATFLNCPSRLLNECNTQIMNVRNVITRLGSDIKFMVQNMLSTVPF